MHYMEEYLGITVKWCPARVVRAPLSNLLTEYIRSTECSVLRSYVVAGQLKISVCKTAFAVC